MSLSLTERAPSFTLPGVDGRQHSLDDYANSELLVLIQSCNHCPYVLAWEGRMIAIQRDYADRGVSVVAVNSNDASRYATDSFEEMKARARRESFTFDYLHDEDHRDETAVARHYLRDALEALLAGSEPPVAETPPVGCTVKWRG